MDPTFRIKELAEMPDSFVFPTLKQWRAGSFNGEPLLVLSTYDDEEFAVLMPAQSARALAAALIQEADKSDHQKGPSLA